MKRLLAAVMCLMLSMPACAHRLDETLQAVQLAVDGEHLQVSLRQVTGALRADAVIAAIDRDGDGVFSPAEQQAYAESLAAALAFDIDERPLLPTLAAWRFPAPAQLREGLGEISLNLVAPLPAGVQPHRLRLDNRHQHGNAAYLVNVLAPEDGVTRLLLQQRDASQSHFELVYRRELAPPPRGPMADLIDGRLGQLFALGMRHIAAGPDHLVFLLLLLLTAPRQAVAGRWRTVRPPGAALRHVAFTISAFTAGHSLTLALTALGAVALPMQLVEILIALSILVTASHCLRPLFAGREAALAAMFGLVHGLAFGATLDRLGQGMWDPLAGIFSFNLGIEAMQVLAIAAVLPSLLLLSGSRAFPWLRMAGAVCAMMAAMAWLLERLLHVATPVDAIAHAFASHAGMLASALFCVRLASRLAGSWRSGAGGDWQMRVGRRRYDQARPPNR